MPAKPEPILPESHLAAVDRMTERMAPHIKRQLKNGVDSEILRRQTASHVNKQLASTALDAVTTEQMRNLAQTNLTKIIK